MDDDGHSTRQPATYRLDVERVLRGRFVKLHVEDVSQPSA